MNNTFASALLVATVIAVCTPTCLAQDESLQIIERLLLSPKMKRPEDILKDFVDGKSTTRVIINLPRPVTSDQPGRVKDDQHRSKLRETIKAAQNGMMSRMDSSNFRVTNRFAYVSGLSAEVTLEGLSKLLESDEVVSIDKDEILEAHLAQGISLMNGSLTRNTHDGAGVAIAICDTGIDYTHPQLGAGEFPNNKVIGGYDTGDEDNDPMDFNGHGTCCAGIAAGDIANVGDYVGGVAPGAKLYALKISFGDGGSAYASDMIEAWEWCITHREDDPQHPIMIISTSFGGGQYSTACDDTLAAMTEAAANAVGAGISLFASSGNDGFCGAINWPACISHVASVGAVYDSGFGTYFPCVSPDSCATKYSTGQCETGYYAVDTTAADSVPSYSNVAMFMDLLAPSDSVYTTDIVGFGGYADGDYYSGFGGTSASCPYAAGAAACLQSAAQSVRGSYLTPAALRSNLTGTGDLITDQKVSITKPRINLGSASEALSLVPLCECELLPDATNVPRGGTLGFQVTVTNNTDEIQRFKWATGLTKPNGNKWPPNEYLLGPYVNGLGPYASKSGHRSHTIPNGAPLGSYTYHFYLGRAGGGILHECQFEFVVEP
jgi:subtilisin family serine protease